jgi:hypothetical protein
MPLGLCISLQHRIHTFEDCHCLCQYLQYLSQQNDLEQKYRFLAACSTKQNYLIELQNQSFTETFLVMVLLFHSSLTVE